MFCPRFNPDIYPNQNNHMTVGLARMIAEELRGLEYEGCVVFSGYGEPLLHPQIADVVRAFHDLHVEIVTNGDRLSIVLIRQLFDAGLSYLLVSMYDGEHQVEWFETMCRSAGLRRDQYALRDRWHDIDSDYGLKLTNRAGTVEAGKQLPVNPEAQCFYPSYSMMIDWNGDALLCVQDWHKRLKFGNVAQTGLLEIWKSKALHKRRAIVARGDRSQSPCSTCNAQGTCHGADHAKAWGVLP